MIKNKLPLLLKAAGLEYTTEYKFHPSRKWRFDFAIVDKRIGIEFEGLVSAKSRHTTLTGYTNDCSKYNAAALLGWKVLRYTALSSETQILDDLKQII